MQWLKPRHIDDNNYNLPGNWLNIEYFEALTILFRIENALRIIVYIVLKEEFKDKWKDLSVTSDDDATSTIGSIANRRLSQDKDYAYLGYVISCPLLHLTSGELIRIITSDSYWKFFKSYFLANKAIIRNKLDEIGNIRNAVAHFRPIKPGDIDLIKQNANHTLEKIEETIVNLIECSDIVPTNTDELWYKEIKVLGINECSLIFKQSSDNQWIKIILSFNAPIIGQNAHWSKMHSNVLNIKTNNILTEYPIIAKYVICATEYMPYYSIDNLDNLLFKKSVKLTFSRKCLEQNYEVLRDELKKVLLQISNEIELIKQDNLAKGKLISVVSVFLHKIAEDSPYYTYNRNLFNSNHDERNPPEFWGQINYASKNYISDTNEFPWMPVNISDDKSLPF